MTASTATLRFTTSTQQVRRDMIARVAAAGRVQAEREAAEARRQACRVEVRRATTAWVEELRGAGALRVGFKVIDDSGKHRFSADIVDAAEVLADIVLCGDEVEAWGQDANSEFIGKGW